MTDDNTLLYHEIDPLIHFVHKIIIHLYCGTVDLQRAYFLCNGSESETSRYSTIQEDTLDILNAMSRFHS